MNYRMMPPSLAVEQNLTINGRNYSQTPGGILDVPDFDMPFLRGNNWIVLGLVGATAARPAVPTAGLVFVDTTVGAPLWWDGAAWRDYAGASH